MPEFKLAYGRLSEYYNHFKEYRFLSCMVTDTRMMGVVALKVTWKGRQNTRQNYYQVIHLDYSEYGVDEYMEFECIPGSENYAEQKEEMNANWKHFVNVMGGNTVNISADAMLKLIELAIPLASDDIDREYDTAENQEFRHRTLMRLHMMGEALKEDGITAETCTEAASIYASIPKRLSAYETINYYIMRLIDHDFGAAEYLADIPRDEIENCPLTDPGIQTLVRSTIRRSSPGADPHPDGTSYPFRVRITTLGRSGYYHSSFIIWLSDDFRSKNPKVTGLEVGTMLKLSDYESALQVVQKEYITVFEVPDNVLNNFNNQMIAHFDSADPVMVPNGWLYTVYKKDNSHVNSAEYRLGDDVYGTALLSIGGQFIIMTHDMNSISTLETSVLFSVYSPQMTATGRYLLEKTPVFHTLCHTPGVLFEDLIEPRDD